MGMFRAARVGVSLTRPKFNVRMNFNYRTAAQGRRFGKLKALSGVEGQPKQTETG